MELQNFGIKDLEYAAIKAKDDFVFGQRVFNKDEPILTFKSVQIAQLSEQTKPVFARGGWGNMPHVVWEDRNEVLFELQKGVLSQLDLGMMFSSSVNSTQGLVVPIYEEELELDAHGRAYLSHAPTADRPVFVYHFRNGLAQEKVLNPLINQQTVDCGEENAYTYISIYYYFKCDDASLTYNITKERMRGNFYLEARFSLKDENDGLLHPVIVYMPKISVVSGINLRLGERANPSVSTFKIVAQPERTSFGDSVVAQFTYLDRDI